MGKGPSQRGGLGTITDVLGPVTPGISPVVPKVTLGLPQGWTVPGSLSHGRPVSGVTVVENGVHSVFRSAEVYFPSLVPARGPGRTKGIVESSSVCDLVKNLTSVNSKTKCTL